MNTATEIIIPADAGTLPSDVDDAAPALLAGGYLPDAVTQPPPLPSVAGLSARELAALLNTREQALSTALATWKCTVGGYPGWAADHRVDVTDPDYQARRARAEEAATAAADDLRRHASAVIEATARAAVTLPADLQREAAGRFALVQGQVSTLPLAELVSRVRAAVITDDVAAQATYIDLLPARLDSLPDTAPLSARDAARDLASLVSSIRANLRERFADATTTALYARAVELRTAATAAKGAAGKRQRTERALQRFGFVGERAGMGKALTPVRDAHGKPAFDDDGNPVLRRYDETDADFAARMELDRERQQFVRSRGTLVLR